MLRDPYDICVAFDDLYERARPHAHPLSDCVISGDAKRVTRNVLRRARGKRLAVPLRVDPVAVDTTARSFQVDGKSYEVLGGGPCAADLESSGLPLYAMILRCLQAAQPAPKIVRLDNPVSYARFRKNRRAACCADLDGRLSALESLISQHIADRHDGGRLAALESAFGQHAAQPHEEAFRFGDYSSQSVLGAMGMPGGGVPIPVVRALQGKVECWQDGEEICCTVRFRTPRGELGLVTTGTPVQRHLEEALCSARVAELEDALPVMGRLAQILGSTLLIPELCRVVPILSTTGATSPMIGVMSPQSTPTVAAAMALLQCCQQGDARACAEARFMEARGGSELLAIAAERLMRAQRAKAQIMVGA